MTPQDGFLVEGEFYHRPIPLHKPPIGEYMKPEMPAVDCIKAIEAISKEAFKLENWNQQCIGCEPVQTTCPGGKLKCQPLIDNLYLTCGGASMEDPGVTLPDGYFYDPQRTITGTWGDEVKEELRIAVGRCACSSGSAFSVGVFAIVGMLAVIFMLA